MPKSQEDKPDDAATSLMRLVDPRMPLPWVVAVIVVAAGMYFQLQSLKEAVVDLQTTVKAGNQSWAGLSSEQALLKFRMNNAEGEIASLRAALAATKEKP